MEKSEPTFVPEWLKSSGGGTSNHQIVSSSLPSDDHVATKASRNKSLASVNDNGVGRSLFSDRITSSYFRRSSSSNGSSHSRSQGSFNRRGQGRAWEKEIICSPAKETHFPSDHRREYSDPLGSILPSRFDEDLRCLKSMMTDKRVETYAKNKGGSLRTGLSAINNVQKVSFERDFPSLGAEEKQASEIKRVSSPIALSPPSLTRGDTWTSALAEVPVVSASNDNGSFQYTTTPTVSLASSMLIGLNMAETVVQGSSRAQTPPELSAGTQRMEELAIKQSKQLIPVTPSMPKTLVLNSSEKTKAKLGLQQISSPRSSSHSPRSAPVTPDLSKLPNVKKLQILKPVRERNGTLQSSEDSSSSPTVAVGSATSKRPLEKKLTPQARSRNDFFNLMRKKSLGSPSSTSDPGVVSSANSSIEDSSVEDESSKGNDYKCNENYSEAHMQSVGDEVSKSVLNEKDRSSSNTIISSEEEEAAFLRSLGWEENGGEDEGLTEEEISSFLKDVNEYIKLRPPSKIFQAIQPKFLESLNSRYGSVGVGASTGSNSADSMLDS